MRTIARVGRGMALAMALILSSPSPSLAQEVGGAPAEGEGEGKPIFGYLACGAGCLAIMFVLSISARR